MYCKYFLETFDIINTNDGLMEYITYDMVNNRDIEIILHRNTDKEEDLRLLKELAINYGMRTGVPLSAIAKIYGVNNINQFIAEVAMLEERLMRLQQEAQQANTERAGEIQKEIEDLASQYKMAIEKQKAELELMKKRMEIERDVALKRMDVEQDTQRLLYEKQRDEAEQQGKDYDRKLKTIETQGKIVSDRMQREIEAIKLQLDALIKMMELNIKDKDVKAKYTKALQQLNEPKNQ